MILNIEHEIHWFNNKPVFLLGKKKSVIGKILSINDIKKYTFFENSSQLGKYPYPNISKVRITKAKIDFIKQLKKMAEGAMLLTPSGETILPWKINLSEEPTEVYIYRFDMQSDNKEIDIELFFDFMNNLSLSDIKVIQDYYLDNNLIVWDSEYFKEFPKYSVVFQEKIIYGGYVIPWFDVFIFEKCNGELYEHIYSIFGKHPNVNYSGKYICFGKNDIGRLDLMDMNLDSGFSSSLYFKYNPINFISSISKYILEKI